VVYLVYNCIKLKRTIKLFARRLNMDCDELLDNLLSEQAHSEGTTCSEGTKGTAHAALAPEQHARSEGTVSRKRARLAALAAGGGAVRGAMSFKGRPLTPERVDAMEDAEIEEAHARYEACLGAAMAKSLGASLLRMYARVASRLLPLPPSRQPELVADLEQDPFVSSAFQSACCELYYRYGMYIAPLTAALTTAKHCDWECRSTVEDTIEPDNICSKGTRTNNGREHCGDGGDRPPGGASDSVDRDNVSGRFDHGQEN